MSLYSRLDKLAIRLIANYGRDANLVVIMQSGEAWNPEQVEIYNPVKVVETNFSATESSSWQVQENDKAFLLDSSTEPTVRNKLRDKEKDYEIVNVREVAPGNQTVLYKIQARS